MSAGTEPMLKLLRMLPEATRARMVEMYRDSLAKQLATLEPVLAGGAPADPELAGLVHKLAGSAAMMQDADLSLPARTIEKALMAGDAEGARALWPELKAAAERTLVALGQV